MNWLKKMDAVIRTLYTISGNNPDFPLIMQSLQGTKIDEGEVRDILLYLYRKGFIYCEYSGDRDYKYTDLVNTHYLISCEGKLFWESRGGFEEKDKKDKLDLQTVELDLRRRIANERMLSRGTIWLAVGTFLLVFVEVVIHWKMIF
jgi:hypothetical protein